MQDIYSTEQSGSTPSHFAHLRDRFVTIVTLGDSITQVNHHTSGGLNWVGLLGMGLLGRDVFPQGFTIIKSGNSGDDLADGLARIDRDVLRFAPDPAIHLPLAELNARWQSSWGEVEVSWKTHADRKILLVAIPPGCHGCLSLAGSETRRELGSGRHEIVIDVVTTGIDENTGD